jgi:hypothetical protein
MLGYMRYFDIHPKRGKNSNEDGMSFKSHARFKVVSTDEDINKGQLRWSKRAKATGASLGLTILSIEEMSWGPSPSISIQSESGT